MRTPCMLFTVRGLMVATAVVALLTESGLAWARQRSYSRMASAYAARQVELEARVAKWREQERQRKLDGLPLDCGLDPPVYRRREKEAQGCALLRRKYEHAAARPWLPVEPDPPEPK